jgi:hypothetical protein
MPVGAVPGFSPKDFGFRFANDFPKVPLRRIGIPGLVSIPIGDASNGLCGGMVFAARDYFEAGRRPPRATTAPSSGPLYKYLVSRLFDSFNLPYGPARYLQLMYPALPDGETLWSRLGLGPHGRAWIMAREEWPKVRTDIDSGHPSALGLVRIKSSNPFDLKHDHQVLAYAYELDGSRVTLRLYDPNWPRRDDISMSLDIDDPSRPIDVDVQPPDWPVYAFFRVNYRLAAPP